MNIETGRLLGNHVRMTRTASMDLRAHIPFDEWRTDHVRRVWAMAPGEGVAADIIHWNQTFLAANGFVPAA